MYLLNVLEIKLLSNCNLNCRGCYVYSNIANTDVYSIDEITTDLDILKEKFPEIREIRILGGEPLVLDNMMEYLELIHTRFPKTILTLVTNGTKLYSQNEEFFIYLSKKGIRISLSYYIGRNVKHIREGVEKLKKYNIDTYINPIRYFAVEQTEKPTNNMNKSFYLCQLRGRPVTLWKRKLYACPKAFSIKYFEKYFSKDMNLQDCGIDIKIFSRDEITDVLNRPMELCKYCNTQPFYMKWQTGKALESDWYISERNRLIEDKIEWYEVLVKSNALVYKVLFVNFIDKKIQLEFINEKELYTKVNNPIVWLPNLYSIEIYQSLVKKTILNGKLKKARIAYNTPELLKYFKKEEVVNHINSDVQIIVLAVNYQEAIIEIQKVKKWLFMK